MGRITAEKAPGMDHPTLDSINKTTQHPIEMTGRRKERSNAFNVRPGVPIMPEFRINETTHHRPLLTRQQVGPTSFEIATGIYTGCNTITFMTRIIIYFEGLQCARSDSDLARYMTWTKKKSHFILLEQFLLRVNIGAVAQHLLCHHAWQDGLQAGKWLPQSDPSPLYMRGRQAGRHGGSEGGREKK